jgi:glycosyltransferase involved in cell wall biosynthesis
MRALGKLDRSVVFVVSPLVPYPPARGVELRIFRMLRWLHQSGYQVVLVLSADSLDPKTLAELRKVTFAVHWLRPAFRTRLGARFPVLRRMLWEPLKRVREFSRSVGTKKPAGNTHLSTAKANMKGVFAPAKLVSLVGRLGRRYHPVAIIAEYIFTAPAFSHLPEETLKIIDTIDVFSRKDKEVLSYGIADPLACSRDEEREYLLAADAIMAIQSSELQLLQEIVPERDTFLAGMDCDVIESVSEEEVVRDSVLIVASDNALNVHGLTGFLLDCWPAIKDAVPSATLHVVGRVGEKCPTLDPAVRFSGWVDDLEAVYREASVVINPTIAGTGLKIKSVQALAHGKPLVAWANGVEGLNYESLAPYKECSSWDAFAMAVIQLLRDGEERRKLSERALSYAAVEFAPHTTYSALKSRLDGFPAADHVLNAAPLDRDIRMVATK